MEEKEAALSLLLMIICIAIIALFMIIGLHYLKYCATAIPAVYVGLLILMQKRWKYRKTLPILLAVYLGINYTGIIANAYWGKEFVLTAYSEIIRKENKASSIYDYSQYLKEIIPEDERDSLYAYVDGSKTIVYYLSDTYNPSKYWFMQRQWSTLSPDMKECIFENFVSCNAKWVLLPEHGEKVVDHRILQYIDQNYNLYSEKEGYCLYYVK